jgi:hypothetical protein
MVNWMAAWWQVHQSWSFMRHAYRCGLSLHADVVDAWSHRRLAMAYAVAQVAPRASSMPSGV